MVSRELGRTGLLVTPICVGGGAPLGSMPQYFGYEVSDERARATVARALDGPLNFLDTAAGYSDGESERRIGSALTAAGGIPPGFVVATKVDRDSLTGDFSGAQVKSVRGSLDRLGVDRVPLLYLQDAELGTTFEAAMAADGAVQELIKLREEGIADHIGIAGGPVELMARYLRTGAFEALITHNRWTLVDRSAAGLMDEAVALGIGVVNGAPFGGGILAKGAGAGAGAGATSTYCYAPTAPEILDRVHAIEVACADAGVPLAAAALQFSLREPRITSTIIGVSVPNGSTRHLGWPTTPFPANSGVCSTASPLLVRCGSGDGHNLLPVSVDPDNVDRSLTRFAGHLI